VGDKRPQANHRHLRARRGPWGSRGRPEGSGASRWGRSGTVACGSENNGTEASRRTVSLFGADGIRGTKGKQNSFLMFLSIFWSKSSEPRRSRSRLPVPIKPMRRFIGRIHICSWCRDKRLGLQTRLVTRSQEIVGRILVNSSNRIVDLTLFNKLLPFHVFIYKRSNSL